MKTLAEARPEQEIHMFGVSRIPKMENYLLASSSENLPDDTPLKIKVTEKTADLFLAPTQGGIRMLSEELPMTVHYDRPSSDGDSNRHELSFYEAICFDDGNTSIVFGLILDELETNEFLTHEETVEVLRIIKTFAVPLYELEIYKAKAKSLEEEVNLMAGGLRDSNPNLLKALQGKKEEEERPVVPTNKRGYQKILDPELFLYTAQLLRQYNDRILDHPTIKMELSSAYSMSGDSTQGLKESMDRQFDLVRNISSLASLLQPNVSPLIDPMPMQKFMQELNIVAHNAASRYHVNIELDPHTRNTYGSGDKDTLLQILRKLLDFTFAQNPDCHCWLRTEVSPQKVETGNILVEIEDDGKIPLNTPPQLLMSRLGQLGDSHPRLKDGGALILKLLDLFMLRSGGKMKLDRGTHGGFTVQLIIPLVSRTQISKRRSVENISNF